MNIKAKPSPALKWTPVKTELTRRCVSTLIWGPEGTWKTSIALGWPGPIFYMSSAENDSGKLERFAGEKEIVRWNFRLPVNSIDDLQNVQSLGKTMEAEFHERFKDALCGQDGKQGWARTIVLDSLNGFKSLQRQADFGDLLAKNRSIKYGPLNSRFEQLHMRFKEMADISNQTYLVYIARASEEYKPKKIQPGEKADPFGVKTGRLIYDVYTGARFDTEIILRTDFDKETHTPSVTVEKPYINAYTTWDVLSGDECCFESIIKNQMDVTGSTRDKLMKDAQELISNGRNDEAMELIDKAEGLEFDLDRWL